MDLGQIAQTHIAQIDPVALWVLIGLIIIISVVNIYTNIAARNDIRKTLFNPDNQDELYLVMKKACYRAIDDYEKGLPLAVEPKIVDPKVKKKLDKKVKEKKGLAGFGDLSKKDKPKKRS